MSEPTILRDWNLRRVVSRSRGRYAGVLVGYDRPDHRVTTSPIAAIDGDTVRTRSGGVYRVEGPGMWARESLTDFDYPFYLDTDGAEAWPPGCEVPPVGGDENA